MWFLTIILAIFIVAKFAWDIYQQNVKVKKEGGMVNKYALLVEHITAGQERIRITGKTATSLDLGVASTEGFTAFSLIQAFSSLTVRWKLQSPFLGTHYLEWSFPEYLDQKKMIDQMNNDLLKYQTKVLREEGLHASHV